MSSVVPGILPVEVEKICYDFANFLKKTESRVIRKQVTIPDDSLKFEVATAFWKFCEELEKEICKYTISSGQAKDYKRQISFIIGPYIYKSIPFHTSFFKPYGYSGDFKIVELMYDFEKSVGNDPYKSGIVNLLDYTFSTIHSVESIWERRAWLKSVLLDKYSEKGSIKILDIACGGSRYTKDFLEEIGTTSGVEITLVDQDPSAINFSLNCQLMEWKDIINAVNIPISKVKKHFTSDTSSFDVIISAGLFDYLNTKTSSNLINHLESLLDEDGIIAITNYSKEDKSGFAKEWLGDWSLIFRDELDMKGIFPDSGELSLFHSTNRSLILANYKKLVTR